MKGFDKTNLYLGFEDDYEYILIKLSSPVTEQNNYALRSINEAIQ